MNTQPKSIKQKLVHEMKAVAFATFYFATWFAVLMFLKTMILSEYKVEFTNISMALVGALILGKVALVIDHIPLSRWTREHAAIYFIIFRTLLNIIGVFIVLTLEKAFHMRHEYGSFGSSLVQVIQHRDVYHIWASVTAVGIAVFWFNVIYVLRNFVGVQQLGQVFFSIPMTDLLSKHAPKEG